MKICARCKAQKEPFCFGRNPQQKDGLHVYCKECVSVYRKKYYRDHHEEALTKSRKWAEENSEKSKQYHREYRHRFSDKIRQARRTKMYGIDNVTWGTLFDSQGRKCAVCRSVDPGRRGWQTDHDHKTGKVRGILCVSCNNGLGRFKDDVESLLAAVEYLRKH